MKLLNLYKSMKIMQKYKIPIPKIKLTKNVVQAIKAAKEIGYPVVIKIVSSYITHKTDVGGVHVNLKNEKELKVAYTNMLKRISRKLSKSKVDGILVQKMVENGQEIIIGVKKDEQFGHVIMFGLGGIFTEVFNDVSIRIVPIDKKDADNMIKEIKGAKILVGYRDKSYNLKSLKEILLKISNLVTKNPKIREMDVNPVIVSSRGAIAVDSRVILE